MTDEVDASLDLTGAGKIAKAIPPGAWQEAVDTACSTFSDLVAPITKTTEGLGRLIEAKFGRLADVEKVFAADAVQRARAKVEASARKPSGRQKARVLLATLEGSANESDEPMREIWANLVANELLDGQVHPEFPRILERLSSHDALALAEIAESHRARRVKVAASRLMAQFSLFGLDLSTVVEEPADFSSEHLQRLDLIRQSAGIWTLTQFGAEFVKAVTDPSDVSESEEESSV